LGEGREKKTGEEGNLRISAQQKGKGREIFEKKERVMAYL